MKPVLIIQNCKVESAGTIRDYLTDKQVPFETIHNWQGDKIPSSEGYSASIGLGCPNSVNEVSENEFLKRFYAFLSDTVRHDRPYLGICAGGQMLAKVLGAKVDKNPVKEIGTFPVRLTERGKSNSLFVGMPAQFPVFQWHGDTFKIPFGAENLAESDKCTNQAFRAGRAVGLQFHFEASAPETAQWCDAYPEELAEVASTKPTVVDEFEKQFDLVKSLNYKFLDNFFALL